MPKPRAGVSVHDRETWPEAQPDRERWRAGMAMVGLASAEGFNGGDDVAAKSDHSETAGVLPHDEMLALESEDIAKEFGLLTAQQVIGEGDRVGTVTMDSTRGSVCRVVFETRPRGVLQ